MRHRHVIKARSDHPGKRGAKPVNLDEFSRVYRQASVLTLGSVIGLFALLAGFSCWSHWRYAEDLSGAKREYGTATVVSVTGATSFTAGDPVPARIVVRFRGETFPYSSQVGFNGLSPGSPVQIAYRVGKSGNIYLENVRPSF